MLHANAERQLAYRAFTVNHLGRLGGMPEIITAADDGDAVLQAGRLLYAQPIEVWEGARLVARLMTPGAAVQNDAQLRD